MATTRFFRTPQDVADAVRAERAVRRWSQEDLARRATVGRRFVSELEAGKPTVELGKVLSVLNALDISAAALPSPRVTPLPESVDLAAHLARFR